MKHHTNLGWRYFKSEVEIENFTYGYRCKRYAWIGAGWYFAESYLERCPRNCCDDHVIKLTTAKDRIQELKEEMLELAQELKVAKDKLDDKVPQKHT